MRVGFGLDGAAGRGVRHHFLVLIEEIKGRGDDKNDGTADENANEEGLNGSLPIFVSSLTLHGCQKPASRAKDLQAPSFTIFGSLKSWLRGENMA